MIETSIPQHLEIQVGDLDKEIKGVLANGSDEELMMKLSMLLPRFRAISDSLSSDQMAALCERYCGFADLTGILCAMAEAIDAGEFDEELGR